MDFNQRIEKLTADGFTFSKPTIIRGTTQRRALGHHPSGAVAQVDEAVIGAAFVRVTR